VVDNKTMKVVATIPVGAVPKRNTSGMLKTSDLPLVGLKPLWSGSYSVGGSAI